MAGVSALLAANPWPSSSAPDIDVVKAELHAAQKSILSRVAGVEAGVERQQQQVRCLFSVAV